MQDTIEPEKSTQWKMVKMRTLRNHGMKNTISRRLMKCGLMARRSRLATLIANLLMKWLLYEAVMVKVG